ncbi:MAG TPA: magnesium chelatase, partial [Phycisphaerae bacterium]|nr:magnesium chelatase [Phycisphaerae bacterium]
SATMRAAVVVAREVQRRRFSGDGNGEPALRQAQGKGTGNSNGDGEGNPQSSVITNATMSPRQIRRYCKLDPAGETLLKQALNELGLSARAHDKVLRIARTIADLEGEANIQSHHIAEAVQYRRLDRRL